jgi:hypothetical protein
MSKILTSLTHKTMTTLEQLQQDIQTLSEAERQLLMDFIQLLKRGHAVSAVNSLPSENKPSFLEVASEFVGCLEGGPGDLATNKKHMEGFGK